MTGTIPLPVHGRCPVSTKIGYRGREAALQGARRTSRHMLARGIIVRPIYVYECRGCKHLHLTRMRYYRGQAENHLILPAAPLDAQLWAMPDHHRARIEREMADEREPEVLRLPDPIPEPMPQRYTNRPRRLRRR